MSILKAFRKQWIILLIFLSISFMIIYRNLDNVTKSVHIITNNGTSRRTIQGNNIQNKSIFRTFESKPNDTPSTTKIALDNFTPDHETSNRSLILATSTSQKDPYADDLVRKHTTEYVGKIAKTFDKAKKGVNLCLELKPTVYKHNQARVFTNEELDLTKYNNSKPLIPWIIHQTWNTYEIPEAAVKYIKSILKLHPHWQYWFWTQQDIECYLNDRHPEFAALYKDYKEPIFKTDVMRYFILYDFGGFYIDLDVEALKPLDIWSHISSSILSHETYEHTFFGHMRKQPNVMTTVLATKAGHPYYKLLQDNLANYHKLCPSNVLYSTGPFYIDNIYQLYVQAYANNSDTGITIIDPRYWLPTYTGSARTKVPQLCRRPSENLTQQQKDLCKKAQERNFANEPFPESYLNHYWMNSNVKGSKFLTSKKVSIFDIAPTLENVSKILGLKC